MSIAKRESLGPAVGAEDFNDDDRSPEGEHEILEEIFESDVAPHPDDVDSWTAGGSNEALENRESLFHLLGDVDSLTRIQVASYSEGGRCPNADETDANLERQADLELAAKIGQALVQKNDALQQELTMSQQRQGELEDNMNQLAHELSQKEELLKQITREWREQEMALIHPRFWDPSDNESESGSYRRRHPSSSPSICSEDAETLQEECRQLHHVNAELLEEGLQLRVQSLEVEKKENDLISQCVQKLADADDRIAWLIEESDQKAEEARMHDEQARKLRDHLDELQHQSEQFVQSDQELRQELLKASQKELELQAQVSEWQTKYDECHEMLKVAQEEVRFWRNQSTMSGPVTMSPSGTVRYLSTQPSLSHEIQDSIETGLLLGNTSHTKSQVLTSTPQKQLAGVTRVMETVKAAAHRTLNLDEVMDATLQEEELATPLVSFHDTSLDSGVESEHQKELEGVRTAVRERSVKPPSNLSHTSVPAQQEAWSNSEGTNPNAGGHSSGAELYQSRETGAATAPDTLLRMVDRVQVYSAPEKLQIVKPLEGSRTLGKWQQLALTGSAGLGRPALELPGIQVKQREQQKQSDLAESRKGTGTKEQRKPVGGLGINLNVNNQSAGIVRRVSVDSSRQETSNSSRVEQNAVGGSQAFPVFQPFGYLSSLLRQPPSSGLPLLSRKQSVGLAKLLSSPFTREQALVERRDSEDSIE